MATGGGSIKGSDAFFDYNCTDCLSRKNAYTEAIFYCQECSKYLCRQCYVCDHDVIGRKNVDRWGKPSTRLQFDPCPNHKDNVIQLYCKKHDVVCCLECGKTKHKLCGELNFIPLVASSKKNTTSLKNIKKGLCELQAKADKLGEERTARLAGLDNIEEKLVAAVKAYRAKLDAWLDDLQQQSLNDIKQYMHILTDNYKSEVAVCDLVKNEMAKLQKMLDGASKDEALMFSRLKQGAEQLEDKSLLISDITNSEITDEAQFVPHTKLEQQVKSYHGLGELLTDPQISKANLQELGKVKSSQGQDLGSQPVPMNQPYKVQNKTRSQGQGLGSQPVPMNQPYKVHSKTRSQGQGLGSQPVPLNQPYTVKSKTTFNVKAVHEQETCDIRGMCQMPDGSIIVADSANQSLKQLDSTYQVTSHCYLTVRPWDVCPTEAGQVAVALSGQTIQFVSVGATMARTKSFSTDHNCLSLAYSNSSLFVTTGFIGGTTIHVYNLSGSHIRTISKDQHGNQLFTNTRRITASPDGVCLYITGATGLVTVDTEGNLRARFISPNLDGGGYAVCVDRSDNVFVGSNSRSFNNVLQIEKGEKQIAKIISSSDGIIPQALCFDGVNLRLLASVWNSDTVHVLHLSK